MRPCFYVHVLVYVHAHAPPYTNECLCCPLPCLPLPACSQSTAFNGTHRAGDPTQNDRVELASTRPGWRVPPTANPRCAECAQTEQIIRILVPRLDGAGTNTMLYGTEFGNWSRLESKHDHLPELQIDDHFLGASPLVYGYRPWVDWIFRRPCDHRPS